MSTGDDGSFDERIARNYDETTAFRFDPVALAAEVDLLAELAGDGPVLEFAVGTGRVALPLRKRGVDVRGIELSTAMVEQMRSKDGGTDVPVVIGDMSSVESPGGPFGLVFLVFNTITNLLTQAEQVACFCNAAAHLAPGGRFLVETGVRDLRHLTPGQRFVPFEVTPEHIGIDEYDVVEQRSISHHVWFRGESTERFDSHHRYATPAEYDLMAQLAGLEPEARWGGWQREPFTPDSTSHVSVWRKP